MITTRRAAGLNLILLAALAGCTARSSAPAQEPAARVGANPAESLGTMVQSVNAPSVQSTDELIAGMTSDEFLDCGTAFAGPDIASDASLAALARRIAQDYRKLNKLTDGPEPAPGLCGLPMSPSDAVMSNSRDDSTHGRKVYHMYANGTSRYSKLFSYWNWKLEPDDLPFPVGTIVVKEAFKPRQDDEQGWPISKPRALGEFIGLFVMFKVDEKSARTDEGWVYATVDRDLKTITSIGVIESCAGCHRQSETDRMIGLRRRDR
ncbi:MAG: cytochrome P460 family protein [Phycisphaerales bacterium]|nr:cytochrome P460 family protein [Phycisphaerales bacterium]